MESKEALEAALKSLDVWAIVFAVVVAIGVGGEAFVGFFHWRWSNQLQRLHALTSAPRRIHPEQHDRFVAALAPFKGSRIELDWETEYEITAFVDDIKRVLADAGWQIASENVAPMGGRAVYGAGVLTTADSQAGLALAHALEEFGAVVGLDFKPMNPGVDAPVAKIIVRLKPTE